MPRFEPFPGLRYDTARVALDDVLAPPYDVVGPAEREALAARSPYNAVHVELPEPEDGLDRYQAARRRLDGWLASGVIVPDPEPAFYVYKMGFRDDDGAPRQTAGVIGALGLAPPGDGGVLPHERTMSRPRGDRLDLMRAARANLSPIWGLSTNSGLSALCDVGGPPLARGTDDDGVHHRVWRVTEPGLVAAISDTVAAVPVLLADGHHRYETALAWQEEVRSATGGRPGDHDLVMAWIVELAADQVSVGPIHRILSGLPAGFDPVAALSARFVLTDAGPLGGDVSQRMAAAGTFAVVAGGRVWFGPSEPWRGDAGDRWSGGGRGDGEAGGEAPAREAGGEAAAGLPDAAVLDEVTATWPAHSTEYTHVAPDVVAKVEKGEADVGLLLRAATVRQIAATARSGRRLPPKATFFRPKPRTGVVFRRLSDPVG
ncbi:MAG: DUF1015 family protein [Acidimicrobiales bacterium]